MDERKIGLVLGGGGGKGAYQIGVWQALWEAGVDAKIGAVSGTSIGALNGAMFCTGDFPDAVSAWQNISENLVLTKNRLTRGALKSYNGWFSNAGVKKLIDAHVDFDALSRWGIDFYATASKLGPSPVFYRWAQKLSKQDLADKALSVLLIALFRWQASAVHFRVNSYPKEVMEDILLASAAIPLVFPDVKIDGELYIDGGIVENIPVSPLYEIGYRKFIIVSLDGKEKAGQFADSKIVQLDLNEPNIMKSLEGTFDFTARDAAKRIKMGYDDCVKQMDGIIRLVYGDS